MDLRLTNLSLSTLIRTLADLLMPRECAVCGRQLLPRERHLCLECEADLPLTHFGGLSHNPMADAFNALVEAPRYVRAAALFYYSGNYRKITQALKYRRNFALGREFGRRLGEALRPGSAGEPVDLVCPVPLHWTRRFSRGYNQAEVIGREVARALGAAFAPRLLRRARRTRTQTALSASDRSRNVSGAFAVRGRTQNTAVLCTRAPKSPPPYSKTPSFVYGPVSILLIDDVFTTGATLAACYNALRNAFGNAVTISVATLAYVDNG